MKNDAFIKVPQELFRSEIYEDKELFHFCLTLMAHARFVPVTVDNIEIQPGQLLTTGPYLCKLCNITRGRLRGFLKRLTDCGFLSAETIRHKYTLITLRTNADLPKRTNGIVY